MTKKKNSKNMYLTKIKGYLSELREKLQKGSIESMQLPIENSWVDGETKSDKNGVKITTDASVDIMMCTGARGDYFYMDIEGRILKQGFKQGLDGQYLYEQIPISDDEFFQHIKKYNSTYGRKLYSWANPENVCKNLETLLGYRENKSKVKVTETPYSTSWEITLDLSDD